jgi:hypothetical protein
MCLVSRTWSSFKNKKLQGIEITKFVIAEVNVVWMSLG